MPPLVQDVSVTLLVGIGAYAWVKMFDALAERRIFDQKLSRKLVHLSAGPLFILSWVLFSPDPYARYMAALVPCMQALRLIAVGTGWLDSPNTVRAVSRSGDRGELLRGPLYYVLIMVAITTLYWRDSPVGIIALALMCGGDGLADIVGRRFGSSNKLPYNDSKSLSGSFAMFAGTCLVELAQHAVHHVEQVVLPCRWALSYCFRGLAFSTATWCRRQRPCRLLHWLQR